MDSIPELVKIPALMPMPEYERMPPKLRETYVIARIKDFVELNKKSGITISTIASKSYFHRHTLARHLKSLVAKGEIYQHSSDLKTIKYFPNGNVVDSIGETNVEIGGKFYTIYKLKNQFGQYIYIQEKRKNSLDSLEVSGGIIIPFGLKDDFLQFLKIGLDQL